MSFQSISGKFPLVWLYTCSATKHLAQHSLLSHQGIWSVCLASAYKSSTLFGRFGLEISSYKYLGRYSFHTSAFVFKKRKTREEKQYKNIIQFKPKPKFPVCELWPGITLAEISKQTSRNLNAVFEAMTYVVKQLPDRSPNTEIHDRAILYELAKKLGYRLEIIKNPNDVEKELKNNVKTDIFRRPKPDVKDLVKRPPVVTIMGHVDHGKTTLLDSLRNTSVTAQEHGGITQHIGAFVVKTPEGDITFLDTPGHAAFQAMRSRGAHATDIVVLVVAADDSVMEQTLESVRFAREAKVPIIVAINKVDKPQANPDQVKKDLLKCGLQLEELGGDIQAVCISALKKLNLNELIEAILTQAEIMEVSGDPSGPVEGIVLETSVHTGKGKLTTALIQRGTLKKGAILVAGTAWAKVKAMFDDQGKVLSIATPGIPVQIAGWKVLPMASDVILEAKSEKHAQGVIQYRETLKEYEHSQKENKIIQQKIDEHLQQYQAQRQDRLMRGRFRKDRISVREKEIVIDFSPSVGFVLKGDVHGSVEAIVDVLSTYKSHEECQLNLIHSGIGEVSENDILLAESFDGMVYCFNVAVPPPVRKLAEEKNVMIKMFNVIYHLIDDLKTEISSCLPPMRDDEILGEANVLQEFIIKEGKKKVHVAGCKCAKGILKKDSQCKIIRNDETVYEGPIMSLKHEKSNVETIKKDVECGLRVQDVDFSFLPGDTIVCFTPKYVPQVTKWNPGF